MSKPRIIARSEIVGRSRQVMCQPTPVYTSPQGEVSIEFDKGDHDAALAALERAVEDVKAQIAESHAPTWDGPRKVGEEPDYNPVAERREPIWCQPMTDPSKFVTIDETNA